MSDTIDPPAHDTISVKFRGDKETIRVPYCEVSEGVFGDIDQHSKTVQLYNMDDKIGKPPMYIVISYKEFVQIVEDEFELKQIVKLSLQKAGTYEEIEIL